jgi:ferric-dicitrate binding protein FerR (iron transport regulator)
MKLARLILVMSVGILAGIAASNTFAQQSPATALGIVVKAENALIGNAALTEGATIYTADYLSTMDNGSLVIRIGGLALELQPSTAVHIYRAPYGAVVELNRGTVLYNTPGNHENIVIVANDVRVTPSLTSPDLGRVSIDDPCNVTVYSQRGQADVRSGNESRTVEEGKSYRVRSDNEISYRQYVSPDENDYHNYHGHKPCVAYAQVLGHAPVAAGSSHFLIVAGATAGVLTGIGIWKAYESPSRP